MATATKNELELQKVVALPGAVVRKSALIIDQRATDKQLAELGARLVEIEGSRTWWLGDYGLELQLRQYVRLKAGMNGKTPVNDEIELNAKGAHYIAEKAEALGIDPGTWRNYVGVCRFFKPSFRNDTLHFYHHVVAMYAAGGAEGDPKRAVEWLFKAEENSWSVSKMREAVNKALATNRLPPKDPEENLFAPLDEADRWAHHMGTQKINPDTARGLLTRFSELIAFVDKLRELAK